MRLRLESGTGSREFKEGSGLPAQLRLQAPAQIYCCRCMRLVVVAVAVAVAGSGFAIIDVSEV